jgi:hypothetical protein
MKYDHFESNYFSQFVFGHFWLLKKRCLMYFCWKQIRYNCNKFCKFVYM